MMTWTVTTPLLAQEGTILEWILGAGLFHLAVVAGTACLLWLGLNWADRFRNRLVQNSQTPRSLFRELCLAHRLTRAQRQLLVQIVEQASPAQPCRVFIDRRVLEEFSARHPAEAEDCVGLIRSLFGA